MGGITFSENCHQLLENTLTFGNYFTFSESSTNPNNIKLITLNQVTLKMFRISENTILFATERK